jgi:Thioredoxin like C-terminal domain
VANDSYDRRRRFLSEARTSGRRVGVKRDRSPAYAPPSPPALNQWALAGDCTVGRQAVVSSAPVALILNRSHARDVNLVMGPSQPGSRVRFRAMIAADGTIFDQHLYQLLRHSRTGCTTSTMNGATSK